MTTFGTRKINVTWKSFGSHWRELGALADELAFGCRAVDPIDGESDEDMLDRVAAEITREFLARAGGATGAGGFAFSADFRK